MKSFLLLLAAVLLSSCATKFTEAERQSLATVTLARTGMAQDAYQRPYAGSNGARQTAGQVGVSSNAGAVGGALGALIGEGIAAAQNGMFHRDNGANVAIVEKTTPRDLDQPVFETLDRRLKKDAFMGSRLRPNSSSVIKSTVTSYGLVRNDVVGPWGNDLRFSPHVVVKIELTNAAGKKLLAGYASGDSTNAHTIAEYAKSPALLRKEFNQAIEVTVQNFLDQLAKKTAK